MAWPLASTAAVNNTVFMGQILCISSCGIWPPECSQQASLGIARLLLICVTLITTSIPVRQSSQTGALSTCLCLEVTHSFFLDQYDTTAMFNRNSKQSPATPCHTIRSGHCRSQHGYSARGLGPRKQGPSLCQKQMSGPCL